MTRRRVAYEPSKAVFDHNSSLEYVKNVLDCKAPEYKGGYETDGHTLLAARYSNLKDEKQKELIANAIVELLDDPDYSCDAIPVAAECGLEEAKEWFLNLAKKSIQELREIKTNDFTNGFGCLIHYANYHANLLIYLKDLVNGNSLTTGEKLIALNKISKHDPDYIVSNYKNFIEASFKVWDEEKMGLKKHLIYNTLCEAFENSSLENCLSVAKKMKTEVSKDIQLLYYNSLKQLPKFKPYLEELKKTLEIGK